MDQFTPNIQNGQTNQITMGLNGDVKHFIDRFETLQLIRDSKDDLIKDLIVYIKQAETSLRAENDDLASRLRNAELNLQNTVATTQDMQQKLQSLETRASSIIQDNSYLKNNQPYVVILIDGDGALFQDVFISKGVDGGREAAHALRSAVLQQCGSFANSIEVIACVYANLSDLAGAMQRNLGLDSNDVMTFAQGFTQAKASFDFVDVGYARPQVVDTKIKDMTKWHLGNYNCKQVILGISHDATFAPFLTEIFQEPGVLGRVTVVEGVPAAREIVDTGVNILNWSGTLLRDQKLIDWLAANSQPLSAPTTTLATGFGPIGSGMPNGGSSSGGGGSGADTPATSAASTPGPQTYAKVAVVSNNNNANGSGGGGSAGTNGGNASPPPQIKLPLQARAASSQTVRASALLLQQKQLAAAAATPKWNPGRRGLDEPITVSQAALDGIKKRKDSAKLCNNHYLRGPCVKQDTCPFEHRYRPSPDELVAIAFLTRLNPCTGGQACEVENCIYGHHCPSVRDGVCTNAYCKFTKEDHPPGTKLRRMFLA